MNVIDLSRDPGASGHTDRASVTVTLEDLGAYFAPSCAGVEFIFLFHVVSFVLMTF